MAICSPLERRKQQRSGYGDSRQLHSGLRENSKMRVSPRESMDARRTVIGKKGHTRGENDGKKNV